MNGPALAQRLVGARPQSRVLFISKPFQASILVQRVRQMLARSVPEERG